MGCEVSQTESTTTVTGPKVLTPLETIDMETMTDAFMTATVLAAVAQGQDGKHTTKITGIANQRVKECDRIAAMIEELGFLGVHASELPDGIQIEGINRSALVNSPRGIKCFDDHRIAMSFSVLACAYPRDQLSLVVTEKKCVEKTWPSWWDTLQNTLGAETVGVDLSPPRDEMEKIQLKDLTIVLIGMRGAGKTHMGLAAAQFLNRKFIDMDDYLETKANLKIPAFIKEHGWEKFRALEAECLISALEESRSGCVIACGGGVIETESSREVLRNWTGLVIHIQRDIESIEKYLNIDTSRPMYGEDMRSVWKRREPNYHYCSNAEFMVLSPSETDMEKEHYLKVEADFARFLNFKLSTNAYPLPTSELSYFVSLTCSNVKEIMPLLDTISAGVDALELRVDLLESFNLQFVSSQIALLRHASVLPIVYTVRTRAQGGRFADSDTSLMIELLEYGLKCGCEYVDVEFSAPFDRFDKIVNTKGSSRLIGSYHDVAGTATWGPNGSMMQVYNDMYPFADIIKLIGRATKFQENFSLYNFVNDIIPACNSSPKPMIALLMGAHGQLSRSLNSFFTPVTHPDLPVSAAPGQVTVHQIHQTRHNIGLLPAKQFCLFGAPITHSMSPTIHNTGFTTLGLPYNYCLFETGVWTEVKAAMENMSGASVTIPLKVHMLEYDICDSVDTAAKKIGAINTLYKDNDGKIHGANTDWIGIKRCIDLYLTNVFPSIGIVIGAGGTSRAAIYALSQIPQIKEIRIWNRTKSKAQNLADEFGAKLVSEFKDCLKSVENCNFIVVSCVPAGAQEQMDIKGFFDNASQYPMGIIVDMAYRPRNTLLLQAARTQPKPWFIAEGIQVLLEQGFEQFEIWTGRKAPKHAIIKEVFAKY